MPEPIHVFPVPAKAEYPGDFFPAGNITIIFECQDDLFAANYLADKLSKEFNIPKNIKKNASTLHGMPVFIKRNTCKNSSDSDEAYTLSVEKDKIEICGNGRRGVLYGVCSLIQLFRKTTNGVKVQAARIEDRPYKEFRGVHVYTPAKSDIEDFKRMIDMLTNLKYNTIILEVGAGMELEKHPEINRTWEKLCREVESFPGGPRGLQASEVYWKDSVHTEVGGGSYISKAEMRDICDYAALRGIEIIPEIQGLSHCYYLTVAHREIAERPNEPYPDSWCPSNPKSYELYFDVAEEILEVIRPERVSIGHDEARIFGYCPRCKGQPGEKLLAYDINKLYEFYRDRGITILMWAEKLMNLLSYENVYIGGAREYRKDERGRIWDLPETYKAVDMIPKDIIMLDWYWAMNPNTQDYFREKGFKEVIGNLHAGTFKDWKRRMDSPNVLGGEVSSWCLANQDTIARNGIVFDFAFSANALWSEKYHDDEAVWQEAFNRVVSFMPRLREHYTGRKYPVTGQEPVNADNLKVFYVGGEAPAIKLPDARETVYNGDLLEVFFPQGENITGTSYLHPEITIDINCAVRSLVFLHACEKTKPYIHSIDFAPTHDYILGMYYVFYKDGSIEPVISRLGKSIGTLNMDWGRIEARPWDTIEVDERGKGKLAFDPPFYSVEDPWRDAVCYFTKPVVFKDEKGDTYSLYAYEWLNPHPEKEIEAVRHVYTIKDEGQAAYLFGVAGSML